MATWTNLQSALTNGPNLFGQGRTIGAVQKTRIEAWFLAKYNKVAVADDISEWLARQLAGAVTQYERGVGEATVVVAELSNGT